MRNFTKGILRQLAEIHHAITEDEKQRDGEEGVHFEVNVKLLTLAGGRAYHERLLELHAEALNNRIASQAPKSGVAMALLAENAPKPPAVDAAQIVAAVKAKKKLSPAQIKQRREAAKKNRKR